MTVAKMMGEIYHSVGILLRPNVTVQDGRQLTWRWRADSPTGSRSVDERCGRRYSVY